MKLCIIFCCFNVCQIFSFKTYILDLKREGSNGSGSRNGGGLCVTRGVSPEVPDRTQGFVGAEGVGEEAYAPHSLVSSHHLSHILRRPVHQRCSLSGDASYECQRNLPSSSRNQIYHRRSQRQAV